MNLRDWLSATGIAMRALATLRQIARALERIAAAQEQHVHITAARYNVKPSKIAAYLEDIEKEPEGVTTLLTQSDEELQALYLQELDAEGRGVRVEDIPEEEDEGPGR